MKSNICDGFFFLKFYSIYTEARYKVEFLQNSTDSSELIQNATSSRKPLW